MISTIAGGGIATTDGVPASTATLTGLNGVCSDGLGNLYMVVGNTVKKIDAASGVITTIAGTGTAGFTGDGGPAIAATLSLPKYIAVDHSGNVYFGDQNAGVSFSEKIRRIDGVTGIITSVIGGGSTLFACSGMSCMIGGLSGMCCDNDDNVIFNEWSCSCRKWDHTTDMVSSVGGNFYMESFKNDTSSDFAYMNFNFGICSDDANNYYIADKNNQRIRKIMALTHTPTFAFGEAQSAAFCGAGAHSIDDLLWVADLDAGETETWTVVTPPTAGTLSGFPATAPSNGTTQTTKPSGLAYTASSAAGVSDMFVVKVSDGVTSDLITIYVQVSPSATISGPSAVCLASSVPMTASIPGGAWTTSNTNATVSSSGMVTGVTTGPVDIIYNVSTACGISTAINPITVDVYPDAGAITGYSNVCEGATITLTDPATGGIWSTSNTNASVTGGVVTGLTAGTVDILYSVTSACATVAATKSLVIDPAPNAGVLSGADEVCTQSTITLTTSSPVTTGGWMASNSNVTITSPGVVLGQHAGDAVITYRVMNECGTATATKAVVVTNCTAADISTVSGTGSPRIFPTPASSVLSISGVSGAANVTITDVAGRVVLHDEITGSSAIKDINVSTLTDGVYTIAVKGDNVNLINKVVISK